MENSRVPYFVPLPNEYNQCYTLCMKTAISIPDPIFEAAEGFAHSLGISRSELYAKAVAEYISSRKSEDITKKLNEVYSNEEARIDTELYAMQATSIPREEW